MDFSVLKRKLAEKRAELLAFAGGFLLSCASLAEGAHPFGVALLCASEKCRPALLLGCVAATPFCGSGRLALLVCLLGCYFALCAAEKRGKGRTGKAKLRELFSSAKAEKPAKNLYRMFFASTAALLTAVGSLLSADTPAQTVMTAGLSVFIPAFCWLFCQFLQQGRFYDLSLLGCAFALTQVFRPFAASRSAA